MRRYLKQVIQEDTRGQKWSSCGGQLLNRRTNQTPASCARWPIISVQVHSVLLSGFRFFLLNLKKKTPNKHIKSQRCCISLGGRAAHLFFLLFLLLVSNLSWHRLPNPLFIRRESFAEHNCCFFFSNRFAPHPHMGAVVISFYAFKRRRKVLHRPL